MLPTLLVALERIERHVGSRGFQAVEVARQKGVEAQFPVAVGAVMFHVPEDIPAASRSAAQAY